jgi:broad specificity phosphatase PhoE
MTPAGADHNFFLDSLSTWPDRDALIGVVRHSARFSIAEATVEAAYGTPLTDEGRALARAFGASLPRGRALRLRYSQVPRCGDTARCIAEGAAAQGCEVRELAEWSVLGGEFIQAPEVVIEAFGRLGPRGFFRAWSAGDLGGGALIELRQAAADVLRLVLAAHTPDPGLLDLHVTHDIVVLALLAAACDVASPDLPWPGYLEGALLAPREGTMHWRYYGRSHETAVPAPDGRV